MIATRFARVASLAIAAVILTTAAVAGQGGRPGDDPEVQGQTRLFSAWLEGWIAYRGLPGVVVGVVADQELIWAQGFGLADLASGRPMTPQTKFRMASHSKLFTATAIMQLREQGRLRLDDPVSKYLPWFAVRPAAPDDPPITIEHLLTHSSGLPREASSQARQTRGYRASCWRAGGGDSVAPRTAGIERLDRSGHACTYRDRSAVGPRAFAHPTASARLPDSGKTRARRIW